jgi:hypothetical protein
MPKRTKLKAIRPITDATPASRRNALVVQPPMSDAQAFIAMIERAARDPAIDVAKLKELLALKNQEQTREAERAFNSAMATAQEEMRPVQRDLVNPHTRSKYASFEKLDAELRPIYTKNGFSLSFNTGLNTQDMLNVTCDVAHKAGFSRHYQLPVPIYTKGPKGNDVMTPIHATGSAITYGRRYLLLAMFNIALTDDDGAAAGGLERISDAQLLELQEMLAVPPKINEQSFCAYMGTDALINLPASKFKDAKDAISEKRKAIGSAA